MTGIDAKIPPPIPKFDQNKYRYPNSRQDNSINDGKFTVIFIMHFAN